MRALPPARLLGLLLGLTVLPVAAAPDRAALCAAQGAGGVPADLVARLARGFNLTGWIEGDRPMPPDPALLGRLRARGLSHVRLPFDGERLMPAYGTRARRAEGLARLDAALRQLLDAGFTVSLDMHPGEGFAALHRAEPERALAMLDAAWAVLARRYAALAPDRLLFEVLNEPPNAEAWTGQMPRAVAALRVHAPGRILVVAPGGPQRVEALAALPPLADPRLVYAVHFYDPMAFTHQGNDWGGADDPLRSLGGLPFPAAAEDRAVRAVAARLAREGRSASAAELAAQIRQPWTAEAIDRQFAPVGDWIARHRRPVIVNEFGALDTASLPDRARWLAAVRGAAERRCIGWTHWDYADAFGFVARREGRERPVAPLLDALIPPKAAGRAP
ncbi:Endoglucanase 3 [Methylobacterium hispanicum]|uniref:Exo-1,3-beta-glucanase D n=1 Tax=Methylobacterium hispanicum TaxID=270350 RepID=A0AAV4ZMQ8_9HYPH|nr:MULTISPECIES: cellulase family glycosylhydrolase [Methylobacterium]GJD89780.1 Endoglucanase 3 [Methylobacterium hispanicum]